MFQPLKIAARVKLRSLVRREDQEPLSDRCLGRQRKIQTGGGSGGGDLYMLFHCFLIAAIKTLVMETPEL